MKYILTNFAQGNAPYILCAHLAKEIISRTNEEIGIIFPNVYGEKQKKILKEELKEDIKRVFFDESFGELLKSIFFSGNHFKDHLKNFVEQYPRIQEEVNKHFQSEIVIKDFEEKTRLVKPSDIICEISRNPQVKTPIKPSFYTSFAFFSEILEKSKREKEINLELSTLSNACEIFKNIEDAQTFCFIQEPNSFSYERNRQKRSNEIEAPLFSKIEKENEQEIEPGIYTTLTGIPNLENLYKEIRTAGLKIYSSAKIPEVECELMPPSILSNEKISFHFCRSGWGSVAKSILTEKPLLLAKYQNGDDPEIFFNNKTLEELKLASILNSAASIEEFANSKEEIKRNYLKVKQDLLKKFNTLDAFSYSSNIICTYLSNQQYIKLKNEESSHIILKRDVKMSKVIQQISCRKESTILESMQLINEAPKKGAPSGICLVTDEKEVLQGIITDGDIRRALLRGLTLNDSVDSIMTKTPITVPEGASYQEILQMIREGIKNYNKNKRILNNKINHVILVDKEKRVKNVMNFYDLFRISEVKTRSVCIIGLGYVGLTLGLTLAGEGFHVVGVDLNEEIVNLLNQKKSHVHEKGIEQLLELHLNKTFFVNRQVPNDNQDIYIVCVGTPVQEGKLNDKFLKEALTEVGKVLKKDDLVILRSTVSVGTCREIAVPLLEEVSSLKVGNDFLLAFAPERTVEGDALRELRTLPQVIGGYNRLSIDLASNFFRVLTHNIINVNSLEEAEMVKLINNTYRDVTFAYANELALVCDKFNINPFDVIRASNEGYPRGKVPLPSPGVGGTCLKKDPHIFCESARKVGYYPQIVALGRSINERMVDHVFNKVKNFLKKNNVNIKESKIFIVGFAFKGHPETTDIRDSTTLDMVSLLNRETTNLYGYDPVVPKEVIEPLNIKFCSLEEGFKNADCVLLMNNHPSYLNLNINSLVQSMKDKCLLVDTWNLFPHTSFDKTKVNYSTLGFDAQK